jgi:hypothetical protein
MSVGVRRKKSLVDVVDDDEEIISSSLPIAESGSLLG